MKDRMLYIHGIKFSKHEKLIQKLKKNKKRYESGKEKCGRE